MIEKVNPSHPDKVADRIAGAIVDLAYAKEENPKIAVEVLIGHGVCHTIIETTADLDKAEIINAVHRIAGVMDTDIVIIPQDSTCRIIRRMVCVAEITVSSRVCL